MTSEKVRELKERLDIADELACSSGEADLLREIIATMAAILTELEDKPIEAMQEPNATDGSTEEWSQVRAFGAPSPKTWDDYEQGCLDTFSGGHHEDGHFEAFQHGMRTVFSLLKAEFLPADVCKRQAKRDTGVQIHTVAMVTWETFEKALRELTDTAKQAIRRAYVTNIDEGMPMVESARDRIIEEVRNG